MSESKDLKDKATIIYLGLAGIVCIACVGIVAIFVVLAPSKLQSAAIPIVASLAVMGIALGYFVGKKM